MLKINLRFLDTQLEKKLKLKLVNYKKFKKEFEKKKSKSSKKNLKLQGDP